MILTMVVFAAAVLLWVCTPLDDTFVALAAVAVLLLFGLLPASALAVLGGATTWLLIAAFVLAAGVTASGLPPRLASWLMSRARTVRGLAHLTALALLVTAFFVPSTSGRAALTLPVYAELRGRLDRRVARAFGVLFPSVILLTAVATVVGAGAHLITNSLLEAATGQGIGFGWWLLLGVPLAVVSAHLTAEIVLWLFTSRADRKRPVVAARSEGPPLGVPCSNSPRQHRQFRTLELTPAATQPLARPGWTGSTSTAGNPFTRLWRAASTATKPLTGSRRAASVPTAAKSLSRLWRAASTATKPLTGSRRAASTPTAAKPLTRPEWTALIVVLAVSLTWLTEPWHGIAPEVTALTGALAITAPRLGTTTIKQAFADIPWSLLLFMAATTMLGTALIKSGAANLVAGLVKPDHLLPTVIVVSLLAHLVIQSRSARSSVLIPIVIPLALAAGMNPAALAFASTAAAGFCHTLTSSAKPVALFADAYEPKDLLKLSAVLAPVTGLLVFAAAVFLWPVLGLPLK